MAPKCPSQRHLEVGKADEDHCVEGVAGLPCGGPLRTAWLDAPGRMCGVRTDVKELAVDR